MSTTNCAVARESPPRKTNDNSRLTQQRPTPRHNTIKCISRHMKSQAISSNIARWRPDERQNCAATCPRQIHSRSRLQAAWRMYTCKINTMSWRIRWSDMRKSVWNEGNTRNAVACNCHFAVLAQYAHCRRNYLHEIMTCSNTNHKP